MATVTPSSLRVALADLIEQASREDDGNFFSGAGVGIFGGQLRITFADEAGNTNGETFWIAIADDASHPAPTPAIVDMDERSCKDCGAVLEPHERRFNQCDDCATEEGAS